MSLSSSLNFAVAGLDLSSRRAEVVARNVANADRPGYAHRSVGGGGPGVGLPGRGVAIQRDADPRLMQLRREAQSREASASTLQTFYTKLDGAIGEPDAPGSLQDGLARLDAAFVSAAASPSSAVRLTEISEAADGLAHKLNSLDRIVQDGRQAADADIGNAVERLNQDLKDVSRLNSQIARLNAGGHDTADLLDQRTVVIDRISDQIPLRELPRDNDAVALVSEGGVLLLDGSPARLGFSARSPITPGMTAPGQLSGLTVNDKAVRTSEPVNQIGGGRLSALFALRDEIAPQATERLDGMAAELIGRFQSPEIAAGGTGLFTDRGSALGPTFDPGLAGRMKINDRVAPDKPGQHYRLRDGLQENTADPAGGPALLLAYGAKLAERSSPIAAGLPDISSDVVGHAAGLRSLISADRVRAENRTASSRTEAETLEQKRDGGAVDVDAEMRRLIDIEQAYAANARIIQAVGDMMNRLTEI